MPARKPKSLLLYHFLLLFTSGLFSVYWLYSLMRDLNYVTGRRLFSAGLALLPTVLSVAVFAGLFVLVVAEPAMDDDPRIDAALMIAAFLSEFVLLATTILIYRGVLFAEGKRFRAADGFFAFGGAILMFFIFPLMQYRVNELILAKNAAP